MKNSLALLVSFFIFNLSSLSFAQNPAAIESKSANTPANDNEKTFYALGAMVGRDLGMRFSPNKAQSKFLMMGMRDQIDGKKLAVDLNEYGPKVQELATKAQEEAMKKRQEEMKKGSAGEKSKGKAYQDKAAKEAGAEKTASGLIYKDLKAGTGASPTAEDTVKVNYEGKLIDGTIFDSSYKRNEPIEFPLRGVIPCWTEGVQKMKIGGKARLICPSEIAYGDAGSPPTIPGGATLVFEVELLDIVKK